MFTRRDSTRRKKIDREFGTKADFLIEQGKLLPQIGPVLRKLHEYRNDAAMPCSAAGHGPRAFRGAAGCVLRGDRCRC
ncbi:hypothetical protein ACWEQP_34710 [Streptomyces sp. NPDC004044]